MKVYLDLLIILNFFYDMLLLMTVSVTLKRNIKFKNIIYGSLMGAISVLIIFLPLNKYLLLLLKILTSFLIIIITFKFVNFNYFFNNIIYLYMCSVILAGFLYFLKIEFNNLSYILILLLAPLILFLYIKEQKKLKEIINYQKKVIITFKNNKTIQLTGFIDSGNRLKDPITRKYIILIRKNKLKGIYNIRSPIYVPVRTINKHSLIECIPIKNIIIDNKIYDNYLLGFTDNIGNFEGADCLLNYHLLEGEICLRN